MIHRLLFVACFCASLVSFNAFCEVDVVDDSENFALLEEQQADYGPPVAHDDSETYSTTQQKRSSFNPSERALARDDKPINGNNNPALLDKIIGLQQEIQELRGQLELQAHELKLLQEQTLSFYKDLDARLRATDANAGPTPKNITPDPTKNQTTPPQQVPQPQNTVPSSSPVMPVSEQSTSNPADEQIRYLAAYELVKKKQFDSAILEMQAFVTKYPRSGYSANAHYWLGELYMVKNNYPQAIEQFNVVQQEFPSSSKSAASLLKMGYALAASGKIAEARNVLQEVVKKYPDTSTAKLAIKKLNALQTK